MNFADLLYAFFDDPGAARLAQAAGVDPADARRVLDAGLPLQVQALAAQAGTPVGAHIAEAVASLPAFESIGAVLNEPDGASNLQQAGELLAPALLGDRAGPLARQVAGLAGTSEETSAQVLTLTLPLLLSLLGRAGLTADNMAVLLEDLSVPPAPPPVSVPGLDGPGGTALLEWLRARLAGVSGERVGVTAGFSAAAAGRGLQAALPVLLTALVRRAGTDQGAQDLLDRSQSVRDLVDADGRLVTRLLGDPAEAARIEGQGRALLGTLFPNLDPVTGRLGSALGSSGTSAGRLLALLAPVLLALLGARARADGLDALAFRALLSSLDGHLWGLLPAGMGGLSTLLDDEPPAVPPVAAVPAPVVPASVVVPPTAAAEPERRGFPWWIIPLLLLLGLGGCWLVNQNRASPPVATAEAASIVVTDPASGVELSPEPFTMTGSGPANAELTIVDQGQEVAKATVGATGGWTADLPAPRPGEHTYTVDGGGARSELKVTVTGNSAATDGDSTDTGSTGTGNTDAGAAAGAFAISEPAVNATLPAGTFTLRGTGTPGQEVELFEDGTSLGKITIGPDGAWSFDVPSPTAGKHTYSVKGPDGADLGSVSATVSAPAAEASAAACTKAFTLSMTSGRTVNEPFRFGGVGKGKGYGVTVKRGPRTIGTKEVPLDATCGWSYQSRPGPGTITYEVRPLGVKTGAPLGTVTLTVAK